MNFEEVAREYRNKFNEHPPILATLSVEDKLYLQMLKDAIKNDTPLTRNDLGAVFMKNNEADY